MKRIIKFLAVSVGVLLLLVLAIAVALPFIIDPNDYKPEITQAVKQHTGRNLTLKGDIELSVFPWLGLELGETRLSNARGFGKKPFVSMKSVGIKVKLLPLLRSQVIVDKVILDGLQLNLARNRKGVTNWDDLLQPKSATGKPAPTTPAIDDDQTDTAIQVGIAGLDVRRGEIHWSDAMTGNAYHVRKLEMQTSNLALGKSTQLHVGFDAESGSPPIQTRVDLDSDVLFDPDTQRLKINKLKLKAAGMTLTASIDGKKVIDAPQFSGTLNLASFNAKKFLADIGSEIKTQDASALTRVSLGTQFSASTKHVSLKKLKLQMDDSAVTGNVSARFASTPSYRFNLVLDQINVDRYLPPASKTPSGTASASSKSGKKAGKRGSEQLEIPVKLLRKLDAKGKFAVKKMKAFGIRSTGIVIPVSAKNGVINVGPNKAKLYQGRYTGNMRMDVRKGVPRYSVNEKLTGVQVGPFLKDADIFDKFSGQGNVSARLTARGLDMDDIINTVNGKASVSLKNGSLSGINIYETINNKCRALQQPGAAPVQQESKNKSTPFADLKASASIVNGVIANQDLLIKGKLLKVSGKGKVNLPKKRVDYLANVNLLGETSCWTTQFAVLIKGRFGELSAGKIIGDTLAYEYKKQIERKAKKALEEELKKRLGIPQKKAAPTTPEKKAAPPKKSLEEQLKEELRKRLGL